MNILRRLEAVGSRIEEAAKKSGRDPDAIKLIAVSKMHPVDVIRSAYVAGQHRFGESRIQEAEPKIASITEPVEWHFIGHLQSNKVKIAVKLFDVIHSVDSHHLIDALDKQAAQIAKILPIFLQVNIADETSKSGIPVGLLPSLVRRASSARSLKLIGLMTIPPFSEDPESSRSFFRKLRAIAFEELVEKRYVSEAQLELSMGMSSDYHVAIEEGATMVRVGTAIFGSR